MDIDIRTLSLMLGITNVLQVIAIFFQYLMNKTYRGIQWWVLGFSLTALGFTLLLSRDITPVKFFSIVISNALIVSGSMCIYIGIMQFFDKKPRSHIIIPVFAVFIALHVYYTYMRDDVAVRTAIVSATLAVTSFLNAHGALANRTRSVSTSAYFLSTVFLSYGCFMVFRSVVTVTVFPVESIFRATPIQATAFLAKIVEGLLVTFGLIIMVNQRLREEIREAGENMKLIFDTSPDAVLITRLADSRLVAVNSGFTALTGFTPGDVIGKSSPEINIWVNAADRQQIIASIEKKGFCENMEVAFRHKDGSMLVGMVSAKIIVLQGVPHIISVTRDITNRKRIEGYSAALNSLYRQLLSGGDLVEKVRWIADAANRTLEADFTRIWIINPGDLCEQGCYHASIKDGPDICRDRSSCLHLIASSGRYTHIDGNHRRVPIGAYKIGRVAGGEWPYFITNTVTRDDRVHDHEWAKELGLVSFAGYRLLTSDGRPVGVLAMFSRHILLPDQESLLENFAAIASQVIIAETAEETLRENEERLRFLSDNLPNGMVYQVDFGKDGLSRTFLYVSAGIERLHGITAADAQKNAMAIYEQVLEEDQPLLAQDENKAMETMTNFRAEFRIRHPSGEIRWHLVNSSPRKLTDGHIIFDGIEIDITDRKHAEEEREKLIRELTEALSQVRALSGLLPICASCKKIRNDKGYWEQIETYIRDHSEAKFSHGICPDCFRKLYPDIPQNDR